MTAAMTSEQLGTYISLSAPPTDCSSTVLLHITTQNNTARFRTAFLRSEQDVLLLVWRSTTAVAKDWTGDSSHTAARTIQTPSQKGFHTDRDI